MPSTESLAQYSWQRSAFCIPAFGTARLNYRVPDNLSPHKDPFQELNSSVSKLHLSPNCAHSIWTLRHFIEIKSFFLNPIKFGEVWPVGCTREGGSTAIMVDIACLSGNYRIEVSGWSLNDTFFVEKTEL